MATGTLPVGAVFVVVSPSSLSYNGVIYEDVASITLGDGTVRTLQELMDEYGGGTYQESDLKACVKVEGVDPDQNQRQLFTTYSTNSHQVGKNEVSGIPGGMWVEMFNFAGTRDNNYILKLWYDNRPTAQIGAHIDPGWLGFRFNYGTSESRGYVLTWVNNFLEESVPCRPTELGVTYMHYPRLYGRFSPVGKITTANGWPHRFVSIREFRLYRTNPTEAGTALFQRVPISPISIAPNALASSVGFPLTVSEQFEGNDGVSGRPQFGYEFRDTVTNDKLMEPLMSAEWSPPPYRAMRGLTAWRNGIMAAFNENTVMFCEPYRPFAWPRKYWKPLPDEVIALVVDDNALVAITTRMPYVFTGAHPAAVSYEAVEGASPGLRASPLVGHQSERYAVPTKAVTTTPFGTIYASPDGLVALRGGQVKPLARDLYTPEEWQLAYRHGFPYLRLAYADHKLVGYFSESTITGFAIDIGTTAQLVKYKTGTTAATRINPSAHFTSPQNGRLHWVMPPTAPAPESTIKEAFSPYIGRVEASYWTRSVALAKPENLGALEVRGYGGAVIVEVFDDRNESVPFFVKSFDLGVGTAPIVGKARLPAGRKARNYSVRVTLGINAVLRELYLASTPKELENV